MSTLSGRKRCLNCPRYFEPRALSEGGKTQKFCSENCRKEFHKHGGAYAKLRRDLAALVRKEVKKVLSDLIEEQIRDRQYDARLEILHVRCDELRSTLERARLKIRNLESASATPRTENGTADQVANRTPGTSLPSSQVR